MIRDYIAAGFPSHPIQFAESFYLHYPRVAFGLWPPLFHIVSGVWMFLFGETRQPVLALCATVTATWGYVFFQILKPRFGFVRSLIGSILLLSLPAAQTSAAAMMLDMAVALAILAAMIQFARYLDTESVRDACLFGLYAAVAALVKYNGLLLSLLPPLCVLLTGRYFLLRRKSFWLPAAIVLAIAGPWYIAMRRLVVYAADTGADETHFWKTAAGNTTDLARLGGIVLFTLGIIGAGLAVRNSRRYANDPHTNLHISAVAILASSWLFHTVLYPIQDSRYLLPAAASVVMLALLALDTAVGALRFLPWNVRAVEAAAMALLVLPYAALTFHLPRKNTTDFSRVADIVLAQRLPVNGVVLVAADAMGEGMFVSEFAMRGPRPRHFVARSRKFLVQHTLMGQQYTMLFKTGPELMAALDSVPVSLVVLDECIQQSCGEHGLLLSSLVREMPRRWEMVDTVPKETGGQIRIYRLNGNEHKTFNRLSIDMRYTLGGIISVAPGD
ncbi:MAG TPA: glycosyltransferase family 39 protein [Bryobacteraceae bacterium]|nr:glycosyltransferase family 39 protein [Bryobacteraceae bacterium]